MQRFVLFIALLGSLSAAYAGAGSTPALRALRDQDQAARKDRMMMRQNMPQWYGTQFTKASAPGSEWELYAVDETAVTEAERAALVSQTLADARARVVKLNSASQ